MNIHQTEAQDMGSQHKTGYKMTELGEIPVDWEVVKLGEVAKTYAGGTPKRGVADYYNGNIPWIKSGEVDNNNISDSEEKVSELAIKETATRLIEPNSILVALYGATAGKIGILKIKACSNQAVLAVNSIKINLLNEFLYHYLKKCTIELLNLSQGSGQPNLSKSIIDSVNVPLPPLPEQTRIAAILSTVDEKIEVIEGQIAETQALKQGLMQRLLTRGIGHTAFKDSELGEIPVDWEVRKLGECCQVHNSKREPINSETRKNMQGNYPYYGPTGIVDHINKFSFDGEYVLIGEDGDHFLKYDTWSMTQFVSGKFNVNNHAHILEGLPHCLTRWLDCYFQHRNIVRFLTRQGAGRYKLTKATLLLLELVVPPVKEQQHIVHILSSVDEKLAVLQEKKAATQELKKGLMQQLLTGKVRVKLGRE